jgi:hypothetical protein
VSRTCGRVQLGVPSLGNRRGAIHHWPVVREGEFLMARVRSIASAELPPDLAEIYE